MTQKRRAMRLLQPSEPGYSGLLAQKFPQPCTEVSVDLLRRCFVTFPSFWPDPQCIGLQQRHSVAASGVAIVIGST